MAAPSMNGKTVLVTGGAGFLGSHVVERAMAEGANVTVVDNLYTGKIDNLKAHMTCPRFKFVQHDVQQEFPVPILSTKFDFIFHMACAASPVHYQADPIGTTLTCVLGTNNILKLAMHNNCPVLLCSTSEVYGDPDAAHHPQKETYWGNTSCTGIRACYDEGKRCAESLAFDYFRSFGVKVRVARIFNTYGPRMCADDGRIVSNFVVQALTNKDITIYGTGEYTRSFQYCTDLVEGFWRLVQHPTETGPVNLGNPVEFSVKEAADLIKAMVPGSTSKIIYLPAAKDDPKQRKPDISKAKEVLGWEPKITFQQGLVDTIQAFRSQITPPIGDRLVVVCNPLLDISLHVEKAFMDKYGLTAGQAGMATDAQMPVYAELEAQKGVLHFPGGSGLNTARVAQWSSQAPKGRFVSYIGCVADDERGKLLKTKAEADGVNMALQYTKDAPTGTCAVCILGKERALLANIAAASKINPSAFTNPRATEVLDAARIVYFTGFMLIPNPNLIMSLIQTTGRHRPLIAMNLSAPFIMQVFGDSVKAVLPFVDILFSNDDEAQELAKLLTFSADGEALPLTDVAAKAANLPKTTPGQRLVVFTAGKLPAVFAYSGDKGAKGEVAIETTVDPAKIVDTNGAGDSFVGGFFGAFARRCPIETCIQAGHYAAGVCIQHDGCQFPAKPEKLFL
jgi:UDP-glucuronate decarboxylase